MSFHGCLYKLQNDTVTVTVTVVSDSGKCAIAWQGGKETLEFLLKLILLFCVASGFFIV